jgi:hypothetical protein
MPNWFPLAMMLATPAPPVPEAVWVTVSPGVRWGTRPLFGPEHDSGWSFSVVPWEEFRQARLYGERKYVVCGRLLPVGTSGFYVGSLTLGVAGKDGEREDFFLSEFSGDHNSMIPAFRNWVVRVSRWGPVTGESVRFDLDGDCLRFWSLEPVPLEKSHRVACRGLF